MIEIKIVHMMVFRLSLCLGYILCFSIAIKRMHLSMGLLDAISRLKAGQSSAVYDYVIGGTAGCVLANRLSENLDKKILVIEAGSSNYKHKSIQIPAGAVNLFKSKFDWDFSSSQNELTRNREIYLCRDENDYKEWAKSVESSPLAKAWIPENILPYFKKSEDNIQGESKYHGTGGEYSVSDVKYQNPMSKAFLHACAEFGLPSNDDFNAWSRSQEGYGRFQVTQKDGVRSSAASGFLEPVLSRKNLKVRSSTLVRKVIFQNKKAIGVEIEKNGKVEIVNLKEDGEVILTGGAINTPQILLLSGIGDKSQLQELNIPVIHDLPGVGKNLQDHPAAVISYKCLPGNEGIALSSQVKIKGTLLPNPKALIQWLLLRSGPLTSTSCDHGGFFKTNPNLTSPDLQIRFISAKAISPDGMGTLIEFQKLKNLEDGFSFQSIVSRPHSRGSVTLKSTDPHDKPVIDIGYLKDPKDLKTLVEGIKLCRKIASTDALKKYKGEEVYPGVSVQSDSQIEEYIHNSVHTSNALVGTCKMGLDQLSVVGADLKVHGLEKIRIADASIMPKIPGGQTAAPVVMIAEKAANFILKTTAVSV